MKIQTTNTATRTLYDDELMGDEYDPPGIRFTDGVARVKRAVGERLVQSENYPSITAVNDDSDDTDNGDE